MRRLQKVKKNVIVVVLDRTLPLLMWVTVVLIYFFRYSAHKNADKEADAEDED